MSSKRSCLFRLTRRETSLPRHAPDLQGEDVVMAITATQGLATAVLSLSLLFGGDLVSLFLTPKVRSYAICNTGVCGSC